MTKDPPKKSLSDLDAELGLKKSAPAPSSNQVVGKSLSDLDAELGFVQAPTTAPFVSAPSAPPSGAGGAASAGIPRPAPTASPSMQAGGAPASGLAKTAPSRIEQPGVAQTLRSYWTTEAETSRLNDEYKALVEERDKRWEELKALPGVRADYDRRIGALSEAVTRQSKHAKRIKGVFDKDFDAITDEAVTSLGDSLLMDRDGIKFADPTKVMDAARSISQKVGIDDEDFQKVLYDRIKAKADIGIVAKAADQKFEQSKRKLDEEFGKRLDAAFTEDDAIAAKAKSQLAAMSAEYGALAKADADAVNARVSQEASAINAALAALNDDYKAKTDAIIAQANSGMLPVEQANAMLAQMQQRYDAEFKQREQDFSALNQRNLSEISAINRRYNQRFAQEQATLIAEAEAAAKKAAEKFAKEFGDSDEAKAMRTQYKRKYEEAWKSAMSERASSIESAAGKRFSERVGAYFGNPNVAMMERFTESTITGLGGSLKGIATTTGLQGLYVLGEEMERAYALGEAKSDEIADLIDPANLAQLSGQLAGGMAPSMAATAATAAATGGMSVVPRLLLTGAAGWGSETIDLAGRAYDDVFKETQSREKASQAARRTIQGQAALIPAYAFEGLPFVGKALDAVPTRALRAGVGATTEFGMEMLQEIPQSIAERNIRDGKEAYEDFFGSLGEMSDSGELRQLLIGMAPITLLGAGGQVISKSPKQQLEDGVKEYMLKASIADAAPELGSQWVASMQRERGTDFTRAVIASLMSGGHINEAKAQELMLTQERAQKLGDEASRIRLDENDARIYTGLGLLEDTYRKRAEEEQNPVLKKAYENRANEIFKALEGFVNNGTRNYVEIKLGTGADSRSFILDTQTAATLLRDTKFISEVAKTGDFTGIDFNGDVAMEMAAEFQGRVANVSDIISRSQESKAVREGRKEAARAARKQAAEGLTQHNIASARMMREEYEELSDSELPLNEQMKTAANAPPQIPVADDVDDEVRDAMLSARERMGVSYDPLDDLPESVAVTFERVEDGRPVSPFALDAASDWLYKKYKDVVAMRDDPKRLLTLEQIDSYAEQLGKDIELLENHKQKLKDEAAADPAKKKEPEGAAAAVAVAEEPRKRKQPNSKRKKRKQPRITINGQPVTQPPVEKAATPAEDAVPIVETEGVPVLAEARGGEEVRAPQTKGEDGAAATPSTTTKENVIQELTDKKGRKTRVSPVVGRLTDKDGNNDYGEKVTFDVTRDGKKITGSGFVYNSVQEFLDAHPEVSEEADINRLLDIDQDLGITRIVVTEHRFDSKTGKGGVSVNVITESGSMEQKLRATGPSPWSKQTPKLQTTPAAPAEQPEGPVRPEGEPKKPKKKEDERAVDAGAKRPAAPRAAAAPPAEQAPPGVPLEDAGEVAPRKEAVAEEGVMTKGRVGFKTKKLADAFASRMGNWTVRKEGKSWIAIDNSSADFEAESAQNEAESAKEAAAANAEFEARQEAFLQQYPEAEADLMRVEEKIAQGQSLTPKEVAIANDNIFRPPGFDFDETGSFVKAKAIEPKSRAQADAIDKAYKSASRFRPSKRVEFGSPISGPSGARLTAYEWKYKFEEYTDSRGEDRVKRVSDWDMAELSDETGRDIVHQFEVVDENGRGSLVSAESALKIMGYLGGTQAKDAKSMMSAAKTLAGYLMQLDGLRAELQIENDAKAKVAKMPRPEVVVKSGSDEARGLAKQRKNETWSMGDAQVWVMYPEDGTLSKYDRDERLKALEWAWEQSEMKKLGVNPNARPAQKIAELERKIATKERQLGGKAIDTPIRPKAPEWEKKTPPKKPIAPKEVATATDERQPAKKQEEPPKTQAGWKREGAKPVEKSAPIADIPITKNAKDAGVKEAKEYAIKGFEEYPVVVVREAKGYRAFVKVGDVEVNISKGHPTEGIVVGDATEMLSRVGKEKLDATVERAMAAQMVKEEGPREQRPSERPAQSGKPNLDKALKALSNFGVSINIHDTKQAYADAVKGIAQGIESTWGVYDPVSNAIHVNKAATTDLKQTFFHETAHPIIDALIRSNPDLAAKFSEEVVAHPNGQKYLDHMALYSDQSAARQVSEVIAEFMGDVAAGRVPVSTKPDSLWQRFKAFIQDILAALGWDTRSIDLSKPDNVREFAAQFKKAMDKGIRITGLEPVSGEGVSMQRPKTTKAKEWNAAVDDAVANNLSKGPEQTITDAAELITDPDGKQAFIDAMNAAWGVTTPPLGTKANQKKVSKVLLREELNKAVEAGKRAGIADVAKARKAFVEQIKEALSKDNLKGALTEAQARSITARAASVNPLNPKAVDRFIAYAERIANDATQAAKEADAKKLRKRIKTAIKGKADERRDAMVNDLAGEFASLNVSDIDLDEYIALGERLLKTLQGTRVKVGDTAVTAIGMDEAVTNAEVQEYVDRQRAKEQAAAEAEAIEEFEAMRDAIGIDEASMTTEELEALIESISGIKARTEAIKKLSKDRQKTEMLRTMARSKLKELEGYAAFRNRDSDTAISKERMKTVADLGKIDIGKLNGEEATYLITAVNNIMLNDRWGGTRDFAAKGRAEEGFAIIDKAFAGLKRIGRPGEENKLFNLTDSTELMAEKIARGPTAAAKFMRAIGMHEWLSSISSAKRRLDESVRRREEYAKSIGFSMTKDDTILNRYRMGFYAYLIQHKGGTAEQIQEQFNKRAYNVRKSIERMKDPDKLSHLKRNEDLYIKAAEDVLGDAENASQLTIDPKLRKMVEFQIKENARLKEETFIAAEDDHNKVLKAYENWTPQRSVASDASVKADQQKDLFEERMWGNRLVDSTPSSSKMDRSDSLLEGHIINPDFFAVQDESMFETLADNLGAQHLATLREAINDPRMRKLVGSSTVKMLQDRVRSIKGLEASKGDLLSGSLAKLYHAIAKRSMQIALKGIAQAPKQATVGFATAISLGKDMDLLPEGYADAVKAYYGEGKGSWQYELIKDEQIHERGKTLAGLEKIGDPIARSAVLSGRENDAKAMAKVIAHRWSTIADKGMIPLAFVDSLSASAAWFAFYKKKLRDKGVDLKSDAWKYEKDAEAAAYANQMVSRQQNANAVESMAQIYREKGGWRIVVDVAFAFSSFAVNMRKRLARDIQTLRTGAKEDRAYAARDLAGAVVETAAFSMLSYFIAAAAKQAYDKLADEMYGEDDDEERIPEDWWKEIFARTAFDLLFGGIPESIGNIPKSGINEAANAIAKHYGTTVRNDGKDLFYIPREAGYGKFGSIIDTASNAYAGLASWAKGREEGRDLAVLSLLSLAGASDQTITRTFERELRKRINAKSKSKGRPQRPSRPSRQSRD